MTDTKSGKRDIHLWWALGIALAAVCLRLWFINFPTNSHPDEPIIANLEERFVEQGILTADWGVFKPQLWAQSTYQFSPYTLVQSLIAKLVYWESVPPPSLDRYILLARITSCCWGGLAVLLVFFLGRTCFSPGAALLGEATLATCFLQVQDSIYARVDSFLGCLSILSLVLAFRAAKCPGSFYWLVAASFSMGVVIAAKYNAFPVLVLIPCILIRWEQAGAISPDRAGLLALGSMAIVGAGFIGATPELLWRPGPLIAGMQFELNHYVFGHIPFQAHDWGNNNFFYWTRYLTCLGLGFLPTLFAVLFIVRIAKLRRWQDLMLGTFLAVSALFIFSTKVRFERNLEICLGPLVLVAGVTAWDCLCWVNRKPNAVMARFLSIAFVALWFSQPLRVLYNFREVFDYKRGWQVQVDSLFLKNVPTVEIDLSAPHQPSESSLADYQQVLLLDFGDPFSAERGMRWEQFFRTDPTFVLVSPWYKHNYPFSTVNFYHGPLRTLVYQKKATLTSIESEKNKSTHVDEK